MNGGEISDGGKIFAVKASERWRSIRIWREGEMGLHTVNDLMKKHNIDIESSTGYLYLPRLS